MPLTVIEDYWWHNEVWVSPSCVFSVAFRSRWGGGSGTQVADRQMCLRALSCQVKAEVKRDGRKCALCIEEAVRQKVKTEKIFEKNK